MMTWAANDEALPPTETYDFSMVNISTLTAGESTTQGFTTVDGAGDGAHYYAMPLYKTTHLEFPPLQ